MNELIQQEKGQKLISGRNIWGGIGSKQEFANWVKDRIEKWELEEGKGYLINLSNRSDNKPGKKKTDYYFPYVIGVALASAENTDISRKFALSIWEIIESKFKEEKRKLALNYALSLQSDPQAAKVRDLEDENSHLVSIISKMKAEKEKAINTARNRRNDTSRLGSFLGRVIK